MQDYDAIPYDSTPIADAHPYKLAALGRLFGLNSPEPSTARILELGCAEGGTLIPLARLWPQAQLVGFDLSGVQIKTGQAVIELLGLRNLRIEQADILQLNDELGVFDYIIAHGVFSWVPACVQDKIFDICEKHLSPHGLAYISYNVNPGWRLRGALRDMFAYHLREETSPLRKLEQAYALCDQLDAGLKHSKTFMATYLREEIAHIRKAKRAYVYHEYLESVNEPLLFSEFIARAGRHQLGYVCDTELHSMFPSSFGPDAEAMLVHYPDVESSEQYIDFLRMRTFRRSVLCHLEIKPEYEIDLNAMELFAVYSNLVPEKTPNLKTERGDHFLTSMGNAVSVSHPMTKVALLLLQSVYPDAVLLPELLESAQHRLREISAAKFADQGVAARGELFNLFANGLIGFATQAHHFEKTEGQPKAGMFAKLQAKRPDGFLSTTWSETLSLDAFSTRLIQLLDGEKTIEEIARKIHQEIAHGDLSLAPLPQKKAAVTLRDVEMNVARLLALFGQNGILA